MCPLCMKGVKLARLTSTGTGLPCRCGYPARGMPTIGTLPFGGASPSGALTRVRRFCFTCTASLSARRRRGLAGVAGAIRGSVLTGTGGGRSEFVGKGGCAAVPGAADGVAGAMVRAAAVAGVRADTAPEAAVTEDEEEPAAALELAEGPAEVDEDATADVEAVGGAGTAKEGTRSTEGAAGCRAVEARRRPAADRAGVTATLGLALVLGRDSVCPEKKYLLSLDCHN